MNSTETVAAGLRALPTRGRKSFSSTQAAWRFYKNENVPLSKLAEPLLEAAHKGVIDRCQQYALCVHDWCRINYRKHTRKADVIRSLTKQMLAMIYKVVCLSMTKMDNL